MSTILKIISNIFVFDPKLDKTAITSSFSGNMANILVSPVMPPVCQMIFFNGADLHWPEHDKGWLKSVTNQPFAIFKLFKY